MEKHYNEQCICHELSRLLEEQQKLSFAGFRFVSESVGFDTIPFMLSNGKSKFHAWGRTFEGQFFNTSVFRLENLDLDNCCATLSLLAPVDIDGEPIDICDDVFSFLKTDNCLIVDLKCFCSIQPLSPAIVNRTLPIVEPKS